MAISPQDYARIEYEYQGHEWFIYYKGKAYLEGAPFMVGAVKIGGWYCIPAPETMQEHLCEYALLAKSQRRHWRKIQMLKGAERKKKLADLKRRREADLKLKSELPWAAATSKFDYYRLTGLDGVYRLARRGEKNQVKAVWFPSPLKHQDAWRRHKTGVIRHFVQAQEWEIFDSVD